MFADEVPAFKMAKKIKAKSTTHEWVEDKLEAVSRTGIDEGADISYSAQTKRARKSNNTTSEYVTGM